MNLQSAPKILKGFRPEPDRDVTAAPNTKANVTTVTLEQETIPLERDDTEDVNLPETPKQPEVNDEGTHR